MQLPEDFTTYTRQLMGDSLYERFAEGLRSPAPVSIRLNPFKSKGWHVDPLHTPEPVPWCLQGFYLSHRPNFTFDPLLHAGAYYVQDASSMFIDEILRQQVDHPVMMLDLCAAPGGKSTACLSALPEGSLLFSNEPIALRAQILSENIQKYGHPDVVVTNNYPKDYLRAGLSFDVILTDVPCSGEGMFRKDEGAISEWSVQHVEQCQRLQREIVRTAWECLRPGGLLIYSTCTINMRENEDQVVWMAEELGAEPVGIDINDNWGIIGSLSSSCPHPVYRFLPGIVRGEGQFMAVMRKSGDEVGVKPKSPKAKNGKEKKTNVLPNATIIKDWLNDSEEFVLTLEDNILYAIPKSWKSITDHLPSLRILHRGIKAAVIKGHDIIPQQSLALSRALRPEAFPCVGITYNQAIAYLRKETVVLPPDTPRGYTLLTYEGQPLGFVKNIGNRANNLYPQEWKVKSAHIPDNNVILSKI